MQCHHTLACAREHVESRHAGTSLVLPRLPPREDTLPAQRVKHACALKQGACSLREANAKRVRADCGPSTTAHRRTMMPSNLAAMKASPAQHSAMPVY